VSRPPDAQDALDQVAALLALLVAVDTELARDPHASGNEIYRRVRASGLRRGKGAVLAAVVAVRTAGGYPESNRGPGRPQTRPDRFSPRAERTS
jgi:hypothetical protein